MKKIYFENNTYNIDIKPDDTFAVAYNKISKVINKRHNGILITLWVSINENTKEVIENFVFNFLNEGNIESFSTFENKVKDSFKLRKSLIKYDIINEDVAVECLTAAEPYKCKIEIRENLENYITEIYNTNEYHITLEKNNIRNAILEPDEVKPIDLPRATSVITLLYTRRFSASPLNHTSLVLSDIFDMINMTYDIPYAKFIKGNTHLFSIFKYLY